MPKIDFKILAKKKGPLPVWAWALISAVLVYMLYRHFRSTEDAAGSPDASTSQMSGGSGGVDTSLGDMTSGGVGNAGNADLGDLGLQHNIDAVKGQVTDLTDFLGAAQTQAANDAAQGTDTTAEADDTTEQGAPLGLVHITGKYWWDPKNSKLVTIPGSGGTKKGSGKVAKPNKNKAGGRKKPNAKGPKKAKIHPAKSQWIQVRPKPKVKKKVIPKPKQPKLTPTQRAAIDRAHHPRPRPPIRKKVKNVRTIRPPSIRPSPGKPGKEKGRALPYRGKH